MIQQLPRLCVLSAHSVLMSTHRHISALLPRMLLSCLFHMSRITSRTPSEHTHTKYHGLSFSVVKHFSNCNAMYAEKKYPKSRPSKRDEVCQVFDQREMLVGQMTVQAAEDLARKSNLRLVDSGLNADRLRSFRLMSGQELVEESKRQRAEKKSDKVKEKEFRIMSNITDHDLDIKVRQAKDVLTKGANVKFVIKGHRKSAEAESNKMIAQLMKKVTTSLQDCAVIKQGVRSPAEQQLLLKPLSSASVDAE
ncbi:translation initiation factor IF-3-like isoform X2 [Littorina saxatilis]|uniref:Translation initiation factor IF-3 n=3 Tax=Littorina saxatilis TaxID=31220 RepID=A0AAN9B246_9CAEN